MLSYNIVAFSFIILSATIILSVLLLSINKPQKRIKALRVKFISQPVISTIIILILFGVVLALTAFLKDFSWFKQVVNELSLKSGPGSIGDFFNGVFAPILGVISIFFLYKAFKEQLIANKWFRNFELERSFKDEFQWLRDKTQIENAENVVAELESLTNIQEQRNYFNSNSVELKELMYQMSKFNKIFTQIKDILENDGDDDIGKNMLEIKKEALEILVVYYLENYRNIINELLVYLELDLDRLIDSGAVLNSTEVKLFDRFKIMYSKIYEYDEDEDVEFFLIRLAEVENSLNEHR